MLLLGLLMWRGGEAIGLAPTGAASSQWRQDGRPRAVSSSDQDPARVVIRATEEPRGAGTEPGAVPSSGDTVAVSVVDTAGAPVPGAVLSLDVGGVLTWRTCDDRGHAVVAAP